VGSASEEFLHFILFPFTKAVQTQTCDEIETAKKCETPPMAHDCSVCLKLLAAFKDPEHDYHANLGSIEDILNSECSSHIELIKDILDGNEEQEPSRSSILEWKTDTSAAKRTLEIRRREGQQTIGIHLPVQTEDLPIYAPRAWFARGTGPVWRLVYVKMLWKWMG
jgi:hypothetical protein